MKQKRHTVDQIIPKLRRADVALGKGQKVPEVCKLLGITEQTYYRWRQKYGSMQPEMAKQLKALEKQNVRLKKLVADQARFVNADRAPARGAHRAQRDRYLQASAGARKSQVSSRMRANPLPAVSWSSSIIRIGLATVPNGNAGWVSECSSRRIAVLTGLLSPLGDQLWLSPRCSRSNSSS